jgi:hypothetical protein
MYFVHKPRGKQGFSIACDEAAAKPQRHFGTVVHFRPTFEIISQPGRKIGHGINTPEIMLSVAAEVVGISGYKPMLKKNTLKAVVPTGKRLV